MRLGRSATWWRPPKKFDPHFEERRISWLELFYDLVYVIAISRITHHLAMHINPEGFLQYACLFILIFWSWLNGSLYYDIHGSEGLRTRLMTLWQVMIIAALAVTIDQPSPTAYVNTTIVFMIMQLYITYLWWSVGFYDRSHRRYNRPYTILFLFARLPVYRGMDFSKRRLRQVLSRRCLKCRNGNLPIPAGSGKPYSLWI